MSSGIATATQKQKQNLILGYPTLIHDMFHIITFIRLYLYEYQKLGLKIPFVVQIEQ